MSSFCARLWAHHTFFVAAQGSRLPRQRGARGFSDSHAMRPVGRSDCHIAGIAARAAERLGESDGDQGTGLGDLVEIGDTLGLSEVIVQKPGFAFESRCRIRVERLMPMKQDLALEMQELESIEADTRMRLTRKTGRVVPALVPVRAHHYDGAFRNSPVPALPIPDVLDTQVIARICSHLFMDRDHHKWTDCICRWKVADRCTVLVPMGRRIELRTVLIRGEQITRGDEPMLGISVFVILRDVIRDIGPCRRRLELRVPEAWPDRLNRCKGVSEVDMLGVLDTLFVNGPEPGLLLGRLLCEGVR